MPEFLRPGVNFEETSNSFTPFSQQDLSTPVFIGYTEFAHTSMNEDLKFSPQKINSLIEYESFFGGPYQMTGIEVNLVVNAKQISLFHTETDLNKFIFYYAIKAFFASGGKDCYIVSIGDYNRSINLSDFTTGLIATEQVNEISLIIYPEAGYLNHTDQYYQLIEQSLIHCENLQDRFLIFDCLMTDSPIDDADLLNSSINLSQSSLRYGAAYYPYIIAKMNENVLPENVDVNIDGRVISLSSLSQTDKILVQIIENYIKNIPVQIPSSSSVAGKYVDTDFTRGIWKAPAGVNIEVAKKTSILLSNPEAEYLKFNSQGGSSINSIQSFPNRGRAVIWGARTLSNGEWKYVPNMRSSMMIESSIRKGILQFSFELNDRNLWATINLAVGDFLRNLWRNGALFGMEENEAFFVRVGLGDTMTEVDITNNLLIIVIGVALSRPAEFTLIRIVQNQSL